MHVILWVVTHKGGLHCLLQSSLAKCQTQITHMTAHGQNRGTGVICRWVTVQGWGGSPTLLHGIWCWWQLIRALHKMGLGYMTLGSGPMRLMELPNYLRFGSRTGWGNANWETGLGQKHHSKLGDSSWISWWFNVDTCCHIFIFTHTVKNKWKTTKHQESQQMHNQKTNG